MNITQILSDNQGATLTPELISALKKSLTAADYFNDRYLEPSQDYSPTGSDERLIFDDKKRIGDWVAEQVEQGGGWGGYYAMGIEVNGEIVAGVVFNNYNESNVFTHIGIKRQTKLLPVLLHHVFQYAFVANKMKRVTALVSSDNDKSLRLCDHIGFDHESVMVDAGRDGSDLYVLVMWPENCRWILSTGGENENLD